MVRHVTLVCRAISDVTLLTEHLIHGGMYARTIRLAAGMVMTGVLIKLPTVLIVQGEVQVWTETGWNLISGYTVLAGSSMRAQVFVTVSDVQMTMLYPTQAQTVAEAEAEFTDDTESLVSRQSASDTIIVTGE